MPSSDEHAPSKRPTSTHALATTSNRVASARTCCFVSIAFMGTQKVTSLHPAESATREDGSARRALHDAGQRITFEGLAMLS